MNYHTKRALKSSVLFSLFIPFVFLFTTYSGRSALAQVRHSGSEIVWEKLSLFAKVLTHIQQSYVLPTDPQKLIEGAIKGMVGALDPHSHFMTSQEYQQLISDTEGTFGGIGVEVDIRDGWLHVVHVMENGPAAKQGILPGDKILAIDMHDARDLRMSDAITWMRGRVGSQVVLMIRREGVRESLRRTLTREAIVVNAVEGKRLLGDVFYVQLKSFQSDTADELAHQISALTQELGSRSPQGLILDMRNNPGGLLDQAVEVADIFLEQGKIVSTVGRNGVSLSENNANREGTLPPWPVVVLINGASASAAEIVAAALKDHRRAVLVGSRTWGKGSVQNIIDLEDGSVLKLTIAQYLTPSGQSIQAHGVEPDITVPSLVLSEATSGTFNEASLEGHLQSLSMPMGSGAGTSSPSPTEGSGDAALMFPDDAQARVGYQVLKLLRTP